MNLREAIGLVNGMQHSIENECPSKETTEAKGIVIAAAKRWLAESGPVTEPPEPHRERVDVVCPDCDSHFRITVTTAKARLIE